MTKQTHSNNHLSLPDYFSLAWREPYRLLFPVGLLCGIIGVLLWPLFYTHWFPLPYPIPHHAHIMIQGFFGSFVFGFLGTAMPRMLDATPLRRGEVCLLLLLIFATTVSHLCGKGTWGHGCFLILLLLFPALMLPRFLNRKDSPPPGFVLVLLGWACAFFGTLILRLIPEVAMHPFLLRVGPMLLYQGFLMLPILGIGAFLFPRFFGLPNHQNFDESRALPEGWIPRAVWALASGLLILVSFGMEAMGYSFWGAWLRLVVILVYLGREVPFWKTFRDHGSLGFALATALSLLIIGVACQALFPQYPKATVHIVLMGGFGILTLTVATRVLLGHSGQSTQFKAKLRPLTAMVWFVFIALLTRISVDVFPQVLISHQIYAALLWIIGVGIWGYRFLPAVFKSDDE